MGDLLGSLRVASLVILKNKKNPHVPMFGATFTVDQGCQCNLWLKDPYVSTNLCRLKHIECKGSSFTLLEIIGGKGAVQVNGKIYRKHSSVTLSGGNEGVFRSSGKHAYIFQQLVNGNLAAPAIPFVRILEGHSAPIKGIHIEARSGDPSAVAGASILALSNLPKELSLIQAPAKTGENVEQDTEMSLLPSGCRGLGDHSLDIDLKDRVNDNDLAGVSSRKKIVAPSILISTKRQAYKHSLQQRILNPDNIEVSFESFPYYLSDTTKDVLIASTYVHLKCDKLVKYASVLPTLSRCIFLSGPAGSEIYQETLAKALAKHFSARLLIVDSLLLPGGPTPKAFESVKEASRPKRPMSKCKKLASSVEADRSKPKKPASSVEADITGGSTLCSQAMPKQEASTASSKSTTLKAGDRVNSWVPYLLEFHHCKIVC